MLQQNNSFFFKSFGTGLSTPVFRGTTASQNKVFWQGVPLTASTHSTFDFSIMPVLLADAVEICFGNSSQKFSPGSFGAGINLITNEKSTKNSLLISQSFGSFSTYKTSLKLKYHLKTIHHISDYE